MPPATGTALSIAQDFNAVARVASNILADPDIDLSDTQTTQLQNFSNHLTDYATSLADSAAWNALHAAQSDLDDIRKATSDADTAATKLANEAAKINKVLTILGDAVALGAHLVTANLPSALQDAANLASAAS